jgi:serine/threonine protein kinase
MPAAAVVTRGGVDDWPSWGVRDHRGHRRGRHGEVYRARDGRLGRDVAIKTLPPPFSNDPVVWRCSNVKRESSPRCSRASPIGARCQPARRRGSSSSCAAVSPKIRKSGSAAGVRQRTSRATSRLAAARAEPSAVGDCDRVAGVGNRRALAAALTCRRRTDSDFPAYLNRRNRPSAATSNFGLRLAPKKAPEKSRVNVSTVP